MSTSHVSVQDGPTTLPTAVGGVSFTLVFDAPGVNAVERPFISYRFNSTSFPVQLQISLNNTLIVDENFNTGISRSLNELFSPSDLQAVGNVLTVSRPGGVGSFDISDIILCYSS